MKPFLLLLIVIALLSQACTTIRQGEIGVRRKLGKIDPAIIPPGPKVFNPFLTRILQVPVTTINLEIKTGLPSKEGLTVSSEISILYKVKTNEVPGILQNVGMDFENILILPVFRSAAADVCARFYAKDMHSSERSVIEKAIKEQMTAVLENRGFLIEDVLMKNITLPAGLAKAIESKLEAEQDAQRMEFVLQREKKDAERLIIAAEGKQKTTIIGAQGEKESRIIGAQGQAEAIKIEAEAIQQANQLINQGLTPAVLKYKSIEAFRDLSKSANTKTIITDGKSPFINTMQ